MQLFTHTNTHIQYICILILTWLHTQLKTGRQKATETAHYREKSRLHFQAAPCEVKITAQGPHSNLCFLYFIPLHCHKKKKKIWNTTPTPYLSFYASYFFQLSILTSISIFARSDLHLFNQSFDQIPLVEKSCYYFFFSTWSGSEVVSQTRSRWWYFLHDISWL